VLRFAEVFGGRLEGMPQSQKLQEQHADGADEEKLLIGESTASYTARVGKWAKEATEALSTPDFWGHMLTSHLLRAPLQRAMAWLQAVASYDPEGLDQEAEPPIVEWVTRKAVVCLDGYGNLLGAEAWSSSGHWATMLAHVPEAQHWRGTALLQLLEVSADAYRRVILPTTQFPMLLAWLAASPPQKGCTMRRQVCSMLLSAGDLSEARTGVDSLSELLRRRFRSVLQQCLDHDGRLHESLHRLMAAVPGPQRS
jgi:hypothetical protein